MVLIGLLDMLKTRPPALHRLLFPLQPRLLLALALLSRPLGILLLLGLQPSNRKRRGKGQSSEAQ